MVIAKPPVSTDDFDYISASEDSDSEPIKPLKLTKAKMVKPSIKSKLAESFSDSEKEPKPIKISKSTKKVTIDCQFEDSQADLTKPEVTKTAKATIPKASFEPVELDQFDSTKLTLAPPVKVLVPDAHDCFYRLPLFYQGNSVRLQLPTIISSGIMSQDRAVWSMLLKFNSTKQADQQCLAVFKQIYVESAKFIEQHRGMINMRYFKFEMDEEEIMGLRPLVHYPRNHITGERIGGADPSMFVKLTNQTVFLNAAGRPINRQSLVYAKDVIFTMKPVLQIRNIYIRGARAYPQVYLESAEVQLVNGLPLDPHDFCLATNPNCLNSLKVKANYQGFSEVLYDYDKLTTLFQPVESTDYIGLILEQETVFTERLAKLIDRKFWANFPWSPGHLMLAGGSLTMVLDESLSFDQPFYRQSDLDFFVLGETAQQMVKQVLTYLVSLQPKLTYQVIGSVITIYGFARKIQLIIAEAKKTNYCQILNDFDYTHLRVCYDGQTIYWRREAFEALTNKITTITTINQQAATKSNQHLRLFKALVRGYQISNQEVKMSELLSDQLVLNYIMETTKEIEPTTGTPYSSFETLAQQVKWTGLMGSTY